MAFNDRSLITSQKMDQEFSERIKFKSNERKWFKIINWNERRSLKRIASVDIGCGGGFALIIRSYPSTLDIYIGRKSAYTFWWIGCGLPFGL